MTVGAATALTCRQREPNAAGEIPGLHCIGWRISQGLELVFQLAKASPAMLL